MGVILEDVSQPTSHAGERFFALLVTLIPAKAIVWILFDAVKQFGKLFLGLQMTT